MQYVWLIIIWSVWCTLHSLLTSTFFQELLRKYAARMIPFYRLGYNIFALVSLIPVLAYSASLSGERYFTWKGPWRIVQAGMMLSALFLFAAGSRRYDFRRFLGLGHLRDTRECATLTDDCSLDTEGILSAVRHPWYTGGIIIVWARSLDLAAILSNLVICLYFVLGAFLEEKKLKARFGRRYTHYQKRVSMFLPLKWLRQRYRSRTTSN